MCDTYSKRLDTPLADDYGKLPLSPNRASDGSSSGEWQIFYKFVITLTLNLLSGGMYILNEIYSPWSTLIVCLMSGCEMLL